jgi:hypothetical protein
LAQRPTADHLSNASSVTLAPFIGYVRASLRLTLVFSSHSDPPTSKTTTMGKSQDSKKQTKKAPLKTPAEKKAAKREKKNSR